MLSIGSTVTDLKGNQVGVVMTYSRYYEDQVFVRWWSSTFKQYLHNFRKTDLLIEADPEAISLVNEEDKVVTESIRQAFIEMALQTHNKEWFDELTKKNIK